jgi:ornithine cyclodeaminase
MFSVGIVKVKVFHDEDVNRIKMSDAVQAVESIFTKVRNKSFFNPPRTYCQNKNGSLVFTVGGDADQGIFGFRVYDTFKAGTDDNQQLVTVYDASNGLLKAIVIGNDLGALRTGAIGGVAIKYLSAPDAKVVGVLGSGQHARTQLMAACAVRKIEVAKVYSRNIDNRTNFAKEMSEKLGVDVIAAGSSHCAVANADILLCATTSSIPVFDAAWLKDGVHINSVGPKFKSRHELPIDLGNLATRIYTDSPAQLSAYPEDHFLDGTKGFERIQDLSELVGMTSSSDKGTSLFLSVGLSGTEPAVANLLL